MLPLAPLLLPQLCWDDSLGSWLVTLSTALPPDTHTAITCVLSRLIAASSAKMQPSDVKQLLTHKLRWIRRDGCAVYTEPTQPKQGRVGKGFKSWQGGYFCLGIKWSIYSIYWHNSYLLQLEPLLKPFFFPEPAKRDFWGTRGHCIFPKSNLNSAEEREEGSSLSDYNVREHSALNSLLYQYTWTQLLSSWAAV